VEGAGGGLTVSGVSRNRGSFVKCVAIQKKVGNPFTIQYVLKHNKRYLYFFVWWCSWFLKSLPVIIVSITRVNNFQHWYFRGTYSIFMIKVSACVFGLTSFALLISFRWRELAQLYQSSFEKKYKYFMYINMKSSVSNVSDHCEHITDRKSLHQGFSTVWPHAARQCVLCGLRTFLWFPDICHSAGWN
jgi:hypothetical protein